MLSQKNVRIKNLRRHQEKFRKLVHIHYTGVTQRKMFFFLKQLRQIKTCKLDLVVKNFEGCSDELR